MEHQRKEPRRSFMCRVEVTWADPNGESRRLLGLMEDRSPSGAGISLRSQIPSGTRVHLVVNRQEFTAVVRNCTRDAMEYHVGVEYEPGDPAS